MKPIFFILFIQLVSIAGGTSSNLKTEELPKPILISEAEKLIPEMYRSIIVEYSIKYGIPLLVFARHLKRESNFNANAEHKNYKIDKVTGKKYISSIDEGIGQLNSRFHKEHVLLDNNGKEFNPKNAFEAIPVIAHYLYRLHKQTNNWPITIAAYNCGLTRALSGNLPKITIDHINYVFHGIAV